MLNQTARQPTKTQAYDIGRKDGYDGRKRWWTYSNTINDYLNGYNDGRAQATDQLEQPERWDGLE